MMGKERPGKMGSGRSNARWQGGNASARNCPNEESRRSISKTICFGLKGEPERSSWTSRKNGDPSKSEGCTIAVVKYRHEEGKNHLTDYGEQSLEKKGMYKSSQKWD